MIVYCIITRQFKVRIQVCCESNTNQILKITFISLDVLNLVVLVSAINAADNEEAD